MRPLSIVLSIGRALLSIGVLAHALGCTEAPITVPLRSLEASGDVSFVCAARASSASGERLDALEGRHIDDCPDFEDRDNHLYALVTQTRKGEIAVVDLSSGRVVDVDKASPGFNFLRVGDQPVDIVSTPGGVASFVGVSEIGKEGIFAIPTSCIGPPGKREDGTFETARDLTTWPACSLGGVVPGNMTILIDRPDAAGLERSSCDGDRSPDASKIGVAADRPECKADLASELGPVGRRKLAVALPSLGGIALIDAQELLDRPQGSFDRCKIERFFPLGVDLPAEPIAQRLPADLQAPGCFGPTLNYGPIEDTFTPWPTGFAGADDRLYVGDRDAPVVHVLDVSDPCATLELPPLLPKSVEQTGRVVTTTEVAVSPPTTLGQRFLYAVDWEQASVMVFDVSAGSSDRTPLVRPGSPRLPFEPPDRIQFGAPAASITFGLRDLPIADENGIAVVGTHCDPLAGSRSAGVAYRPASDLTKGAAPRKLRGVFGFVALTSGQIAIIDVEDFDAECRRPVSTNPGPEEDFRGCKNDPSGITEFRDGDTQTVSNEVSCRVVQPHRARAASYAITSPEVGVRAPSLRAFPTLTAEQPDSDEPGILPRLLGVAPADASPAEVYVGTTLYSVGSAENELVLDPGDEEMDNSVLLPFAEPRSYPESEDYTLTFEGSIIGGRQSRGQFQLFSDTLKDLEGTFCGIGVQDMALAREMGFLDYGVPEVELEAFATSHADYVQVTSEIPDQDEPWWTSGVGASCGAQPDGTGGGFLACSDLFGPADTDELNTARDLRIVEAFHDELRIEPRDRMDPALKQSRLNMFACCFPQRIGYTIRGGQQWILRGSAGFRHSIVAQDFTDANGNRRSRCVRDCRPRNALQRGRALEVRQGASCDPRTDVNVCVCTVAEKQGVKADSPCVFENLTARFAVYRGSEPSARDMSFGWRTIGGFSPLAASLASQTLSVLPQSIVFVPQLGQLAVVDAAAAGLSFVSLDSIAVSRLFF